jgi:hypothetical protein
MWNGVPAQLPTARADVRRELLAEIDRELARRLAREPEPPATRTA